MKSVFAAALLALIAGVASENQTIAEIVAASGTGFDDNGEDFDLLLALVGEADLVDTLGSEGPFTVFAPNDAAFLASIAELGIEGVTTEEAAAAQLGELVELAGTDSKATLSDLLLYHVVPGKLMSPDVLAQTTLTTASSQDQTITRGANGVPAKELEDLAPDQKNPTIITLDVEASNGVVHIIDRVLWNLPVSPKFVASTLAGADAGATTGPSTTAAADVDNDGEDDDEDDDDSVCFPASAVVHTADGRDLPIARVAAGDSIKTDADAHSPVYLFSHRQLAGEHEFVRVEAESGHVITLSANHYLYVDGLLAAADTVRVGDVLATLDGPSRVKRTNVVREQGLFAPHTMQGDIVVNGIKASTYTRALHPTVAHVVLAPLRVLARMGVVEPLGAMLYDGAPRLAKLMPKGH